MTNLAFALEANIYCKDRAGVKNVLQEDGWECRDILTVDGGVDPAQACFTGKRAAAIQLLNSLAPNGFFDGTDGMSINGVKFSWEKSLTRS